MPCARCPCKESCLAWPAMCAAAAEDPPDPGRLRWIRERSAAGAALAAAPAPAAPDRPDAAAALAMVRRMNECRHRSTEGCGCSGARCGLRGGAAVSHVDCFACLRAGRAAT